MQHEITLPNIYFMGHDLMHREDFKRGLDDETGAPERYQACAERLADIVHKLTLPFLMEVDCEQIERNRQK